jgi:copper(I)-binding protein
VIVCLCLAAGVVALSAPRPAEAGRHAADIVVRDAWIREGGPTGSTAAYFVVQNRGARPVRLIGADVEGVGVVEMHEMKVAGDMMSMAKIEALDVAAGATVAFAPGGHHLMLFQLKRSFTPGGSATITLRFADGTTLEVQARVRPKSELGA